MVGGVGKTHTFRLRFRGWLELALPRQEQLFVHGQVNRFFWLRSARMKAPGSFEQLLFSFGFGRRERPSKTSQRCDDKERLFLADKNAIDT